MSLIAASSYYSEFRCAKAARAYFMYIVRRITLNNPFNCSLEAMIRHARHSQSPHSVLHSIGSKPEEWINMDHLATNGNDPCSLPGFVTLLAFRLWAVGVMAHRGGMVARRRCSRKTMSRVLMMRSVIECRACQLGALYLLRISDKLARHVFRLFLHSDCLISSTSTT